MSSVDLKAYIDESGTHDGSPLTIMSGLVSSAEEWEKLEIKWRDLLARHQIDFLHGKELRQGSGQFSDRARWPMHTRQSLAFESESLVKMHCRYSVSALLKNSEYDTHYIGGDRKLRSTATPSIPNMASARAC